MPNNKYIINESQLVDIADAIRTKLNEQDTYTVDEMPEKISEISGGSSNEEYVILPAGEYEINPSSAPPMIAGIPVDANYITVKIAGEDYIFEYTDNVVDIGPDNFIGGYYNNNFSNLAFVPEGGNLHFFPVGTASYSMTIDEIRAKPNNNHYFILIATIINEDEWNSIYVNDVITLPEKILCLENGNIVDKADEEIPAGTSLILNIIVGSDFSETATPGWRQTFTVMGNVSDLNNCIAATEGSSEVISVIPDYFPINGIASVTITAVLPK